MNENRKIPELRFPEYTDDWKDYRIGELFDERREKMPDGELLSVTIKDGIKKHSESGRRDSSSDDKSNYKKVCVGDIAYNSMRMWQGASGFSEYEGIISPAYTVIKPKENVDARCAAYLFKRKKMTNIFQRHSQGVASDTWNLKYPELSQIHIMFPRNVAEQHRISSFFSKIDSVIALQQQYVDQLKEFKKGCLQKMFPKKGEKVPEMRFPGFTDDWEQRKLEDVFEEVTDYVAAGSFADIAANVQYLDSPDYAQLVRTVDLKHDFQNNGFVYINKNAFDYLYRVNLDQECIILPNIGANIGEVYYLTPEMLPYGHNVLGPNAILLRPKKNGKFLAALFNTDDFQYELSLIVASSGQPKFNKTELRQIRLVMPSKEEQEAIGNFFAMLDKTITLHQRKLDEMKEFKKGCLQKMFV